jgi:hypothetical protein
MTPEEQIRATLLEAQAAAEAGEAGDLKSFVSPEYADGEGRDKRAIDGLLVFYLMRNKSIYLHTRIGSIRMVDRERGEVELLVAVAGSPIEGVGALADLSADLLRMNLEVSEEGGGWKVTSARWRRAELGDFL